VQLHLDILPPAQRKLWDALGGLPSEFVLYGGTAIALQLGHRQSVDFDFFTRSEFDPEHLLATTPLLAGADLVEMAPNTLTLRHGQHDPVLLSFFGVARLPTMRPPHTVDPPNVRIADLLELAGMKAMVVQKRAEAKDYLDLHALIHLASVDLGMALAAANVLYAPRFSPESTLKALCFFGDGDLDTVPKSVRDDLMRAVRVVDPTRLPTP
jgi:hypothetical protein